VKPDAHNVLNNVVAENGIGSVIEYGCGNGDQLSLARYPRYVGVDISRTALSQCHARFSGDDTKTSMLLRDNRASVFDLAISLKRKRAGRIPSF
jgi:SAM-dependent methyltransferase